MENLFNEILGMSMDGAWLIGAVVIVRVLLYKAPKYFYKILWGLVGLRLLIPFSFESTLSLVPQKIPETVNRVSSQVATTHAEQSVSAINIIAVVWGIVGVAFMLYGVISYLRLRGKIFDSVIYRDNIYYSERIESPFVCGFLKPKIYIPYGLDAETEKCVLQHEKTHIKHADHILKYLGFAVLCIHWFNPLVWVSYFLLCKDIELSCDESVVKNYDSEDCKKYAKALSELGVNKVKLSACPVAFGEVSIKKRIKSVITYKKAGNLLILTSLGLCAAVAVCFMTEPEAPLKEKVEITQIAEKVTDPETEKFEETTEAVTEVVEKESVTEAVTEIAQKKTPVTESVTESVKVPVTEENTAEETTKPILIIEKQEYSFSPVNSFYTEPYEEPDTMRELAEEAGVFVNDSEKEDFAMRWEIPQRIGDDSQ